MRLCVFCGSKHGARPVYAQAAEAVGRLLASWGVGVVYGGGHVGLMGVVADAALRHGGKVIGVIPRAMVEEELAHGGLSELHVVTTMHERKALMAASSDGFLALPGGLGTAEEFFEIVTWRQLELHRKPVGLLNIEGYFDPLLAWIERGQSEGFIKPRHAAHILSGTDPEELLHRLLAQARPGGTS